MPIYEYKCNKCDNKFDVFTSYEKRNNIVCPKCGNENVKILISQLGYIKHPTQVAENNQAGSSYAEDNYAEDSNIEDKQVLKED